MKVSDKLLQKHMANFLPRTLQALVFLLGTVYKPQAPAGTHELSGDSMTHAQTRPNANDFKL